MSQITALPLPVPSSIDPANFDARADAFLGALPDFATEANVLATEMNSMSSKFNGLYSLYPASGATVSYNPGSGSLSITIQTGKAFVAGMPYTMYASGSPTTHYITGIISSYNSGSGAIVITRVTSLGGALDTSWILTTQGAFPVVTTVGSTMYMADVYGSF
jgi:hypothetical protein